MVVGEAQASLLVIYREWSNVCAARRAVLADMVERQRLGEKHCLRPVPSGLSAAVVLMQWC